MKDVACASGIGDAHFIGGRIPETESVPSQGAIDAERGTDGAAAELAFKEGKSLHQVGFAGGGAGEVSRGDGIVDEAKKRSEIWRPTIDVSDNGNAGGTSPSGGLAACSGIAAIDVD